MASEQPRLKGFARAIGFFSGAVLLGVFMCTSMASAQCGPTWPTSVKNTACGTGALASVTTGQSDSAFGHYALNLNTKGGYNTASGADALRNNTTGYNNTASGTDALEFNTTGYNNTANGANALEFNTKGQLNTASGTLALYSNTMGSVNTASGDGALSGNFTGNTNIGIGFYAGYHIATGSNNIVLGYNTGSNIQTGSNNIDIGGAGTADDSDTIRIGTNGTQSATYIAGISAAQVIGNVVEVNSNGQLGIATSSARYKRDIRDMGGASAGLMKLRPVTFRYKNDPSDTLQYGLVAEEVARVYPELVTRGPDGKVQSVRYLELNAILLNQLQKQNRDIQRLSAQVISSERKVAELQASHDRELRTLEASFEQRLSALEQTNHREMLRPAALMR